MLTLLFVMLLLVFVANVIKISIKAAWGITKFALSIIVFPMVLIGLAFAGFFYVALAILMIVGIASVLKEMTFA